MKPYLQLVIDNSNTDKGRIVEIIRELDAMPSGLEMTRKQIEICKGLEDELWALQDRTSHQEIITRSQQGAAYAPSRRYIGTNYFGRRNINVNVNATQQDHRDEQSENF